MLLFFNGDLFIVIGMLVIFLAPIAAIGWIIYSLVKNRTNTSITDWRDSDRQ